MTSDNLHALVHLNRYLHLHGSVVLIGANGELLNLKDGTVMNFSYVIQVNHLILKEDVRF